MTNRHAFRVGGLVIGVLLGLPLVVTVLGRGSGHEPAAEAGTAPAKPASAAVWTRPVVSAAELADRNGVKVTSVRMSGAGGLLDLRFIVTDPLKAHALHDAANPPALVDEDTGVVVSDLLMGHSHTGNFRAGAQYYLVFENPGNLVHAGSKVSVLLGYTQVEHVVVE